jgi:hypothetical protein
MDAGAKQVCININSEEDCCCWFGPKMNNTILIRELLEDADLLDMIRAGAYATIYDSVADYITKYMSEDLSIDQIQNIIWWGLYEEFCVCENVMTKTEWTLDENQAMFILGSPSRFKSIATGIRNLFSKTEK